MNKEILVCFNVDIRLSELVKDSQQHEDLEIAKEEAWKLEDLVKKTQNLKEMKTTEYNSGTQIIDLGSSGKED